MIKSMTASQSSQLINAKYNLSTLETKFILFALTKLDSKKDTEFNDEYEIKVSDLENEMLFSKDNDSKLKKFAKTLLSKPLEVETDDGWIIANWFADIEYKRGQARFLVTFSKKLKPYLLELKNKFVSYNLKYILRLKSTYSIRIYQLLLEYKKLGKRTFKVSELQDILQVPKSLLRYSQFKQKILTQAQNDLTKYTDIEFKYSEIKIGRKVDEIVFYIKEKEISKELVTIEDIPDIIYNLKGLYGFKNDIDFYTQYADKSLKLEKEDGTFLHFKSLKQLEYKADKGLL